MALENLDISMFTERSGVDLEGGDRLLLVTAQGNDGCVKVSLIMSQIRDAIQPSISELGTWVIGTTDTGVTAVGKTPQFMTGELGIMWKYESDTTWKVLASWSDIKFDYDELTDEQKASLKLNYSDLTEAEIAELQKPANDMIAVLETTNTNVQNAEAERVQAENARVAAEEARVSEFSGIKSDAEQAVSDAQSAVDTANEATEKAEKAVEEMETLKAEVEQAISDADSSAASANTAASSANKAATSANTAASNANTAASGATQAKTDAVAAANAANEAAEDAQDTADHPTYIGEDNYVYKWNKTSQTYDKTDIYVKGEAFNIKKVWASLIEQKADTSAYNEGDFGLINTGDVEQEDNAKLYVYQDGAWVFLVDMSGAIGFTGKTPQITIGTVTKGDNAAATLTDNGTDTSGNPKYNLNLVLPKGDQGARGYEPVLQIGTVTTGAAGTSASATLIESGTTSDGNPLYVLSMTIPKGDKGQDGTGSGNVYAESSGLSAGKTYLFKPDSDNSVTGTFVEYEIPTIDIPTKTSQLENDSDFATNAEVDEKIDALEAVVITAEDEGEVIDAMETLTTDALRKTEQTLTDAEKSQARTNIGAVGTTELATKQDVIGDLDSIRSGAAKGATALQSYTEKYTGTYNKPSTGIPKSDLASDVQTSLGKADTALQSYTETDPVFAASPASDITSSDIENWNGKTSNTGTITGITMNGASKGTSGVVDLGTVITEHQDISGKQDKIPVTEHGTGDTTFELTPNVLHVWGEVTTLTLTLATPSDTTVYNEYMFQFTSGETATTLSLPETIQWVSTPSVEAGYTYQCSIVNNIGVIASVANS